MDWEAIKSELQKPLDPSHVKPPPQGKYGEYVDGYHVISEANRIFGEDGWSYEITDMQAVSRADAKDRNGNPQIRVGYYCAVKVYVNGASFKHGAAVGSGIAKPENEADAHESAVKEAETDALKRALRTYGNTFGLALYDKTKEHVRRDEPKPDAVATRDRLLDGVKRQKTKQDLRDYRGSNSDALTWLQQNDPPKFNEVKAAMMEAAEKLQDDPARQAPPPDTGVPGAFGEGQDAA